MTEPLTDDQFLSQIQTCELPSEYFTHEGHLRLAWLLATKNKNSEEASAQACQIIREYATSLGAKDKFHRTLTEFLQQLVCYRHEQACYLDWPTFLLNNQDIALDCLGVLDQYYDNDVLFSERAKRDFVAPDKRGLKA